MIGYLEGAIITQLFDHDPKKRPSAQELLNSTNMPPPLLEKPNEFFQRVKSILFPRKDLNRTDYEICDHQYLLQLCLEQKTPEEDVIEWLSKRINNPMNGEHISSVHKFFFKRCQKLGAKYFQVIILKIHLI